MFKLLFYILVAHLKVTKAQNILRLWVALMVMILHMRNIKLTMVRLL